MEGYDNEFVPAPESRYECPICFLVLREPYQTKCGHIFCRDCIIKSLRDSSCRCPLDNEPLQEADIYPDNFAKREILNFNIKCPNNKDGCDQIFQLKTLENHLVECDFSAVSCPYNCGGKLWRWNINDHITSSCENRMITCEHCRSDMQVKVLEDHLLDCPKIVVACPHCGVKKVRSEVLRHVQEECNLVVVKCPFYLLGCNSSMIQSLIEEHLMLAGSSHMKQLCHAVTFLSQQLGMAQRIHKTLPKNTYESQELIQSGISEPDQCGKCSLDINTNQSPIISGVPMPKLRTLNLEQESLKKGEMDLTAHPCTGGVSLCSLDDGQFRFALNSSTVNSSGLVQQCTSFLPKHERANISAFKFCRSSHSSTATSPAINQDSETRSYFYRDFTNETSSSDMMKVINKMYFDLRARETVMQDQFQELYNRFTTLEEANSRLKKVMNNLEQSVKKARAKFYNGDFCWCISNFSQYRLKLDSGESSMLHSPSFYTNPWGYKMCVRANIDKCSRKGQLSLFVHLMRSKNDEFLRWPFSGKISICVVDQNPDSSKRRHVKETLESNPNLAAFQRPTTPRNNKGFGYIGFLSISELESSTVLMNDTLVIRTQVFSNCQ